MFISYNDKNLLKNTENLSHMCAFHYFNILLVKHGWYWILYLKLYVCYNILNYNHFNFPNFTSINLYIV